MQAKNPALEYIPSAEASLLLQCCQRHVSRLADQGKIASVAVNRRLRLYSVADVTKLAQQVNAQTSA